MMARLVLVLMVAAPCLFCGSASGVMGYSMTDLGTLGVGRDTIAYAINDAGQVVGRSGRHAFVWDAVNGMQDLTPLNANTSEAVAINEHGQIVGTSAPDRAVLWDRENGMKSLFSTSWYASGINESGQIVGAGYLATGLGFLWEDGVLTNIGNGLDPAAINDAGQVVGSGFLWESGTITPLPFGAKAINNIGQVAGTVSAGASRAVIWDRVNGMQYLRSVDPLSLANGINDSGCIVGMANFPDRGYSHPFVYSNGVMTNLTDYMPHNFVDGEAYGINNKGQIVGYVWDPSDGNHGFLLTPSEIVYFPNADLKALVAEVLRLSNPTVLDMLKLTTLSVNNTNITSLDGLEYATNLQGLALNNGRIGDLSLLAHLTKLSWLELSGDQISDLSPLSGLKNLQRLTLSSTSVTNLSPLSDLTNLYQLELRGTQVSDLSPLASLANLHRLELSGDQVYDLSPLSGLTNLTWLSLKGKMIGDLSPLSGLTNLKTLFLYDSLVSDLSPLSGLINVTGMWLNNNQICDLSPLSGLANLEFCALIGNHISSIPPLTGLPKLSTLGLTNNLISDISGLSGLTSLGNLDLGSNQISDLSPLVGLTTLAGIVLTDNPLGRDAYCHDLGAILLGNQRSLSLSFSANANPPGGVSATDGTDGNKITIGWEALCPGPNRTDTFKYIVYRSTSLDGARVAISGWLSDTSFDDTTAFPEVHYWYWVKSDKSGEVYSDPDQGWRGLPTGPSLVIFSTGGGWVTTPGEGAFSYDYGTSVPVVATPIAPCDFINWTGSAVDAGKLADPASASTTVMVDGPYTLQANFTTVPPGTMRELNISSGSGGHVSEPGEGTFEYEDSVAVSVIAVADGGYHFTGWTGTAVDAGKVAYPASASTTVTMDDNYDLRANFEVLAPGTKRILTVGATPGGSVWKPGKGTFEYDDGTDVSVVAVPDAGYQFVRWTGTAVDAGKVADPESASIMLAMDSDYSLTANFEPVGGPVEYKLAVSVGKGGYVSEPGEGKFTYEVVTTVPIVAHAYTGYRFSGWRGTAVDAGKVASTTSENTTVMVDGDYSLQANFIRSGQFSVKVLAPNGGESLQAGGTFPILWQTQGEIAALSIDLTVDGGSTWTHVGSPSAGVGSYDWPVPKIDSDRCLIRICVLDNAAISDVSDAFFSIHKPAGHIWYVDAAAAPGGDGTSWETAFVHLQDGLARAADGDSVWVTEGLYWPDLGTGQTVGDRAATFRLKKGVAVCGGFPTGGGVWQQRNPFLHQSILSGNLGDAKKTSDNSYHVVTGSGTDKTAVWDGCTIAGGFANGAEPQDRGAGLYNLRGSPQIRNCIFVSNTAAAGNGGGVCNIESNATFTNCVFNSNTAGNCGGGVYNEQGNVTITNCTFMANQGLWRGGGVFNAGGMAVVTNCILWANSRMGGESYDELAQISGDPMPTVERCCVQGWTGSLGGPGNFGWDPLFVNAAGLDKVVGTADDDLRLQVASPCIDQGNSAAVPTGVTTDQEGNPRIRSSAVDVGAYEFAE